MSFVITDTSPVFTSPLAVTAAPAGTNTNSVDATTQAVQLGGGTTSGTNTGAAGSVTATNTVAYTTASSAPGQTQQVVVSGAGTRLNVSAGDALIQVVGGGAIVETALVTGDGSKTINLGDSSVAFNGVAVDTAATVSDFAVDPATGAITPITTTVAEAAGNQGGNFAYYAHGGTGADVIQGSSLDDFIRGGAGNDTISAFDGNDLIRGGSGSDSVTGGAGADTLYYTADQFNETVSDSDIFTDFVSGTDKISIDSSVIASTSSISGLGTNTITLTSTIPGKGTVQITSNNSAIQASDINFI